MPSTIVGGFVLYLYSYKNENMIVMNQDKNTSLLFTISLTLGIILTARTLIATKKEEEELSVRIARLEERVDDLE
jgi:hypothetical protein